MAPTWQHVSVFCDVSVEKPALDCFRDSEKIKTNKPYTDLRPALFSFMGPAFKERLGGSPNKSGHNSAADWSWLMGLTFML